MKKIVFLLLLIPFFTKAQIGGAGLCTTNGNPNNVTSLEVQDLRYECAIVRDTSTNNYYSYNKDRAEGERWVLLKDELSEKRDTIFQAMPTGAEALLTANKFVPIYFDLSGNAQLAKADNENTMHQIYIVDKLEPPSSGFIVQQDGSINAGTHPFTIGRYIYLDSISAGNVSHDKFIYEDVNAIALTTSKIWLIDNRPTFRGGTSGGVASAENGLTIENDKVVLGQPVGTTGAKLLSDREIPYDSLTINRIEATDVYRESSAGIAETVIRSGEVRTNREVKTRKGVDADATNLSAAYMENALTINYTGAASTTDWIHIKIPNESGNRMYMFHVHGFNQQTARREIYDFKASALIVGTSVITQDEWIDYSTAAVTPDFYLGGDGSLYLKFKPAQLQYLSLWVDLYACSYSSGLDTNIELEYAVSDTNQ